MKSKNIWYILLKQPNSFTDISWCAQFNKRKREKSLKMETPFFKKNICLV